MISGPDGATVILPTNNSQVQEHFPQPVSMSPPLVAAASVGPSVTAPGDWRAPVLCPPAPGEGCPRLSEAAAKLFCQTPPSLELNHREIEALSSCDEDRSIEVERSAAAQFDAEPVRFSMRTWAAAGLAALPKWNRGDEREHQRVDGLREESDRLSEEPSAPVAAVRWLQVAAWRFWMTLGMLLMIVGAAVRNAMYFLEPGLGVAALSTASLALASVVGVVPGLLAKWALSGLGDRRRRACERRLKAIALPLAVAGLVLFAVILGQMNGEVNVFEAESSWSPPFWVLVAVAQALEVLASIALFLAVEKEFGMLCPRQLIDAPLFVEATQRTRQTGYELGESAALRTRLEHVLARLASERIAWCLHVVRHYQACRQLLRQELAVEQASHRYKRLQEQLSNGSSTHYPHSFRR